MSLIIYLTIGLCYYSTRFAWSWIPEIGQQRMIRNKPGKSLILSILLAAAIALPPSALLSPYRSDADSGVMRWDTVNTPNSVNNRNDILNPYINNTFTGSEIRDLAVANDGRTLLAAVTVDNRTVAAANDPGPLGVLYTTANSGIYWNTAAYQRLAESAGWSADKHVYHVAVAPDDAKIWVVTAGTLAAGPVELWVTTDGGAVWNNTNNPAPAAGEAIGAIDISMDYGNGRDYAVGTRSGAGNGRLFIMKGRDFGSWAQQMNPVANIDYFALKFSPTYNGDSSVVMIYADINRTSYNIGLRDISSNSMLSYVFPAGGVEVATTTDASPSYDNLAVADLSLPSDYSGMSPALRRAFVSLYAPYPDATNATGVFRIDNGTTAALYNSTTANRQVYSIAFFGTYASGKLLAGFAFGSPCNAMVPTLLMDTPCACAGSCGYVSLKPPTGAGNQGNCGSDNITVCSDNLTGVGAALVAWNPEGSLGYAATGSGIIADNATWWNSPDMVPPLGAAAPWISTLIPNDESAFSISRNNGDTWNQLALIDTTIDWFNDVAVSADCTTLYLASVHRNIGWGCNEFDSVWRATVSPGVAAPLPAIAPMGTYWERVMLHTTSACCRVPQTDLPILRTVNSCTDSSDGGVVAWASRFAPTSISGSGLMAWSPDYGDYWVAVTPRYLVEDFTFESSRVIYVAGPTGMVQRLVYTGTAWSTNIQGTDSNVTPHTITARNGKVLVGANQYYTQDGTSIAYSADSGVNFYRYMDSMPVTGNVHVIFDTDFENNRFIYAAVGDNVTGTVYRNTAPSFTRWSDNDMMDPSNGADGPDWWEDGYSQAAGDPPHRRGYFGIVMAFTGLDQPALYAAHDNISTSLAPAPGDLPSNSGVCRTLESWSGMPKPGVYWDCLDIYQPPSQNFVHFTLEPSSLKICGCCSPNTNSSLWAIDNQSGFSLDYLDIAFTGDINAFIAALSAVLRGRYMQDPGYNPAERRGMLWVYTDCLAKKGPALRTPSDGALVGADPVTGRNQQIDLSWEQLCLSTEYEIEIAKDAEFTLRIDPSVSNATNIDIAGSIRVTMDEFSMTKPGMWLSPAALPEAGATYYWHVQSYRSATGQIAVSPWSETRSFTVKPGFIVHSPYYGVQLLAPDNGCVSCKVRPLSFSWSPWKEANRYEFHLSEDPEFTQVLKQVSTSSTGYEYSGTLDYDTNYFWRVRATEVNGQPITSDWSATFSFRTEETPAAPEPAPKTQETPFWVWIVIGVGTLLVIVTLILILRTRKQF